MTTKFLVTVDHNNETWGLRGTVWAYTMDRATRFETREAAERQLARAKQFMKATIFRKARITEEVTPQE